MPLFVYRQLISDLIGFASIVLNISYLDGQKAAKFISVFYNNVLRGGVKMIDFLCKRLHGVPLHRLDSAFGGR